MASADNQKQGRRNMRPVGWNSKNHNCGSPCQISAPQVGVQCSCRARRLKRMKGRLTLPRALLSPLWTGACGEHVCRSSRGSQWLQGFPLAQPGRELKFINSFYYLILLLCGAQLQIVHSRCHKVKFLFPVLCLRSACSPLLERSNVKHVRLLTSICLCPEVDTHEYVHINIAASTC